MTHAEDFHAATTAYDKHVRSNVPRYDELQQRAIDAIPFAPTRVLELGFGTAETTRRIWERYPDARITGIDSTPEMVFRARELGWEEMRLGRMQDPLPDGPWDLVIGVLSVNHIDDDGKRDLFRRVRSEARALVIGDLVTVAPEERVTPLDESRDFPAPAADQAEWCGGEVVWEDEDLAVIRAIYE
jgi:tRNA (cmo5U34)-methyltransferase